MCKPDKSFNTWVKVIFRHMKMPCKSSRAGGAPSRTDALIGPAALLVQSYASRFRNCALQRAPVRWTLTSEPTIGGSLRLCQSRNGATNSTTAEESFPGDVTQQFQVSTREQPKEHELTTWHPKQRTELTRENEAKTSILLKPTQASNKLSIPNPDWTGKIWSECSNKADVFVRDLFLVS